MTVRVEGGACSVWAYGHNPVIAIDGPAGAGKSTIAKLLASRLGLMYLDTGAMYRAVGLLADRAGIHPPFDAVAAEQVASLATDHRIEVTLVDGATRVMIDANDVSAAIRAPRCSAYASAVSTLPKVRKILVRIQRGLGSQGGVMEGRDMGSVVFPDADLKVYLDASAQERARRRHQDLLESGVETSFAEVLEQQEQRDQQDRSRADSPLTVAAGALVLDTTGMKPDEVVQRMVDELARASGGCDRAMAEEER